MTPDDIRRLIDKAEARRRDAGVFRGIAETQYWDKEIERLNTLLAESLENEKEGDCFDSARFQDHDDR